MSDARRSKYFVVSAVTATLITAGAGLAACTAGTGIEGDFPDPAQPTATATVMSDELANCSDGMKNGSETGVDCGGSCPTPCVLPAT